jgi:lactoylglutathione lyase
MGRVFPVVYVRDVPAALRFYADLLGFEEQYRFPPDDGTAVYVGLTNDGHDLGVVHESSPQQLIGRSIGEDPRFELFVYVEDVDATVERLRGADVAVLREPEDMPWGERLAFVADPEGNPVTLAAPSEGAPDGS